MTVSKATITIHLRDYPQGSFLCECCDGNPPDSDSRRDNTVQQTSVADPAAIELTVQKAILEELSKSSVSVQHCHAEDMDLVLVQLWNGRF
jgi:hypothetical protein